MIKLLDYRNQEAELEQSTNPFAIIVLAYLKTIETTKDPEKRLKWKFRLFKLLYQRGYSKEDILELTRFLDWIMVLPDKLEQRFDESVEQYEEEFRMQYVTTFERKGIEKGLQQGLQQGLLQKSREAVIEVLRARFKKVSNVLINSINTIDDVYLLRDLLKKAATTGSVAEFKELLTQASLPE